MRDNVLQTHGRAPLRFFRISTHAVIEFHDPGRSFVRQIVGNESYAVGVICIDHSHGDFVGAEVNTTGFLTDDFVRWFHFSITLAE